MPATDGRSEGVLGIALVGYGYWGPNLARNLGLLPGAELRVICDTDETRLAEAARHVPTARRIGTADELLDDASIDAVVVATPAASHATLARSALEAGKHALVEKPLALNAAECADLGEIADAAGLTLMVGHTFLYNSAVQRLRAQVQSGELGTVLYAYARRLNLGRVRDDVNVLWNLAPHDVSILSFVLDAQPEAVSAHGRGYLRSEVEDVVFLTLEFPGGSLGHIHVSWLDPRKVREVTVVGTNKMVIYDDVNVDARIQVFDKGIDVVPSAEGRAGRTHENLGEFQTIVRSGDLLIPRIDFEEPLRAQCHEFVTAIAERRRPLTDAEHARRVVQVLEAADQSLRKLGERITIDA